jgi:helicase
MSNIPVLEYEQMSGRAGRPSYDNEGQAICIAQSVEEQEEIWEQYINGEPEDILSKLAVEPVMRTYVLSLIATGYAGSITSLNEFMSKTFYAHQYKDVTKLESIVRNITAQLEEWEFITIINMEDKETVKKDKKAGFGFTSAKNIISEKNQLLKATKLGSRIAELYLDPATAHYILECMKRGASKQEKTTPFALLQMICWTAELRPLLSIRKKDIEAVDEKIVIEEDNLLCEIPDSYTDEFDDFSSSIKTAMALEKWTDEITEEQLLEDWNLTPGELNAKLERSNWLLYSSYELSKIQGFRDVGREILKLKERIRTGVKEELLPLIKLKGIGRVRARKMFNNKIRDLGEVKKVDVSILGALIGDKIALDIKKQVGQDFSAEKIQTRPNKRKGQIALSDYGEEE